MLKAYMLDYGFSPEECWVIISSFKRKNRKESTIYDNTIRLLPFLESIGYKREEIIKKVLKDPLLLSRAEKTIRKKIDFLKGISEYLTIDKIRKMFDEQQRLLNVSLKSLKRRIDSFIGMSYTIEEVAKIVYRYPSFLTIDEKTFKRKLEWFQTKGFSDKNLKKMVSMCSKVFDLGIQTLEKNWSHFQKLTFTDDEIRCMCVKFPNILCFDQQHVSARWEYLKKLGFTDIEIKKIFISFPVLFGLSIENIESKIALFTTTLQFTMDEFKRILLHCPTILGQKEKSIADKIAIIDELGLRPTIIKWPTKLVQGSKLTLARVAFLKSTKRPLSASYIFESSVQFQKRFNISKKELLEQFGPKVEVI